MGKVKREKWTKEEVEVYLSNKYPKGLERSEQEIDIEARKAREKEAEKAVEIIINILEDKEGEDE